jgi:inhibitor of KinA
VSGNHDTFRIVPAGDAALVVELPARIDPLVNARLVAMAEAVRARTGAAVLDVVIGFSTLTVYYDPVSVDPEWLEGELTAVAQEDAPEREPIGARIDVPVCYGGELGPDLAEVAAISGCTEEEVVRLHTSVEYRVFVVGFVPGFAYMGVVDTRLALPRRAVPRTKVPAGSVAIAAGQTGIYPSETPGGWHLLGRTKIRPFDPSRAQPALFRPGDRVRFRPVGRDTFERSADA